MGLGRCPSAAARHLAGAFTAAAVLSNPAPAQTPPAYPAALERQDLINWLHEETSLKPEQVVAVSASALTAIVARIDLPGGTSQVRLRAEALTPAAAARGGVLSWEMALEVDCQHQQVRTGGTTGFASREPTGDGIVMTPGEPGWRRARPGTPLEAAWRAVCAPAFHPPLLPDARLASAAAPPAAMAAPDPALRSEAAAQHATEAAARESVASLPAAAPAPAPAVPAEAVGRGAVQVISSPAKADAVQALARMRERFAGRLAALDTRIEAAVVNRRTTYRGLVVGFSSRREAAAFCRELQASGRDCVPR